MSDPLTEQFTLPGGASPTQRTVGLILASTNTTTGMSPTHRIHHVSGTSAIQQINVPYPGFKGKITFIPDAAFTGVTTGTGSGPIGIAFTAVTGKALDLTFDGALWYPSYTS